MESERDFEHCSRGKTRKTQRTQNWKKKTHLFPLSGSSQNSATWFCHRLMTQHNKKVGFLSHVGTPTHHAVQYLNGHLTGWFGSTQLGNLHGKMYEVCCRTQGQVSIESTKKTKVNRETKELDKNQVRIRMVPAKSSEWLLQNWIQRQQGLPLSMAWSYWEVDVLWGSHGVYHAKHIENGPNPLGHWNAKAEHAEKCEYGEKQTEFRSQGYMPMFFPTQNIKELMSHHFFPIRN